MANASASASQEEARARLRRYVDGMPTFSPATAKIIQLSNQLNAPAAEIVSAIRLDPILTGKVLQLVNSAYFGLAQKITSLNRALVYLGINTIKNLALSTAVMEAFDAKNKEVSEMIKPAWRHSLATAVCAKNLAKASGVPSTQVEDYFIAGLLHDLGQITLMQAFYPESAMRGALSPEDERNCYGQDHNEAGAGILKKWKFPEEMIEAIRTYHSPAPGNKLANLLHLADAFTYRLALNGTPDPIDRPVLASAWGAAGLSEEAGLKELNGAADQIAKAEVFLNIAGSKDLVKEEP